MNGFLLYCLPLFFTLFFTSCRSSYSSSSIAQFSANIMTIDYHISVGGPLSAEDKFRIRKIIEITFQEIDHIYNKWNPQSELSRLNQLAAGTPLQLSTPLYHFFQRLDLLVNLTEGRFDPTIEPLQHLWKEKLEKGDTPLISEIDMIIPLVGWHKIHFENGFFMKDDEGIQLDLGGSAKGLCVDLLIERLMQAGFPNAYVEWGGEIRTNGTHPSGRPWQIFISRLGDANPEKALDRVILNNQAIATSGDYYQNWKIRSEAGEERVYSHIFNPKTLLPLEIKPGSIASISVVANDCVTADVLATSLMLFENASAAQAWLEEIQKTHPDLACWIVTR